MTDPLPVSAKRKSRRRKVPLLAADAKGVARMMSASVRTVRMWDAAGRLPRPHKIVGKVLWSVEELRAWIKVGAPDRTTWEAMKKAHR